MTACFNQELALSKGFSLYQNTKSTQIQGATVLIKIQFDDTKETSFNPSTMKCSGTNAMPSLDYFRQAQ